MTSESPPGRPPLACRVVGHQWRFAAEARTMMWSCARCGEVGGIKEYGTAAEARKYARAFDSEPARGERRFLLGAAPLWLWRKLRRRGEAD